MCQVHLFLLTSTPELNVKPFFRCPARKQTSWGAGLHAEPPRGSSLSITREFRKHGGTKTQHVRMLPASENWRYGFWTFGDSWREQSTMETGRIRSTITGPVSRVARVAYYRTGWCQQGT